MSLSMPLFTLAFMGDDKSTMRHHLPGFAFFWDNPKWAYVAVNVWDLCWRNDYHVVEE